MAIGLMKSIRTNLGTQRRERTMLRTSKPVAADRGAIDTDAIFADTMRRFPKTMARLAE